MINIGESNNRPQKTVNFPAFKKNVGTSQIQTTWLSVKKVSVDYLKIKSTRYQGSGLQPTMVIINNFGLL